MDEMISYCAFENGIVVIPGRISADEARAKAEDGWGDLRSIGHVGKASVSPELWQAFQDNKQRLISVDDATSLFVDGKQFHPAMKMRREPEGATGGKPQDSDE